VLAAGSLGAWSPPSPAAFAASGRGRRNGAPGANPAGHQRHEPTRFHELHALAQIDRLHHQMRLFVVVALCALVACADRMPQLVAVVQPIDRFMDCPAIQAEVLANNASLGQRRLDLPVRPAGS
jgi:hypothetical protein